MILVVLELGRNTPFCVRLDTGKEERILRRGVVPRKKLRPFNEIGGTFVMDVSKRDKAYNHEKVEAGRE